MQIRPLVGCAIQSDRQVLEALALDFFDHILHHRLSVRELDWRQVAFYVDSTFLLVPGLRDSTQKGVDGVAGVRGILLVGIGEVGRPH